MAFGGEQAKFDNLKIGYDNNTDNDIDDLGDDVVLNDAFDGTSVSPTYDDNGNLTKDAECARSADDRNSPLSRSTAVASSSDAATS